MKALDDFAESIWQRDRREHSEQVRKFWKAVGVGLVLAAVYLAVA